jgi:hypothetical protein
MCLVAYLCGKTNFSQITLYAPTIKTFSAGGAVTTAGLPYMLHLTLKDDLGNNAFLVPNYTFLQQPFYTGQDQNLSLMQVSKSLATQGR